MQCKVLSLEAEFFLNFADRLFDNVHRAMGNVFGHDDRRTHAEDVTGRNPGKTLGERTLVDQLAGFVERLFRRAIFDQLDAHQAALDAAIADDRELIRPLFHPSGEEVFEFDGMVEQVFFFDHFDRGQRGRTGHRVAAIAGRRADLVDCFGVWLADDHRGDREAVSETLAERDDVRQRVPIFHAEPLSGSAHAGENFVGNEKDLSLVAELAELREEIVRRHDTSAPALDRLEDKRGDLVGRAFADESIVEIEVFLGVEATVFTSPPGAIGVGPRNHVKTGSSGRAAELGHSSQADRVAGLAMEVHEATEELMFSGRGTSGSKGCFDGCRSAIIKLHAGQVARHDRDELFEKLCLDLGREVVRVHQTVGPMVDRFANLRVTVAQVRYIDTAGKIDVLVAINVGHRAPGGTVERDREELDLAGKAADVLGRLGVGFLTFRTRNLFRHEVWYGLEVDAIFARIITGYGCHVCFLLLKFSVFQCSVFGTSHFWFGSFLYHLR